MGLVRLNRASSCCPGREGRSVEEQLRRVLEEAADSRPFASLLAAPGPVRRAQAAAAGQPFVAAVLAQALDAPVLVLGHEPRAAEHAAATAAVFIGPERVIRFPAWESLPYEGISPSPQVAGARARAAHLLRAARGPCVVAAPVLAAIQGLVPTLGEHEPLELRPGLTMAP